MPRDGAEASVGAPAALEGPPLKTMRPDACLAPAPIGAIGAAETAKPTAACVGSGASASPCPPAPTAASAAPSNFKRKLSPWTRNFLDGAAQRQQRAKVHAQEPTAQPPLDDVFIEAFRDRALALKMPSWIESGDSASTGDSASSESESGDSDESNEEYDPMLAAPEQRAVGTCRTRKQGRYWDAHVESPLQKSPIQKRAASRGDFSEARRLSKFRAKMARLEAKAQALRAVAAAGASQVVFAKLQSASRDSAAQIAHMRQQIAVRAAAGVDAQLAAMRAKIAKRELAAHRSDCIFSAASGSAADADAALDAPAAADAAAPGDAHEDAAESEKMQSEASNDGRDVAERCDAADGLNLPTPQPPRSPTPRSPTPEPCAPEPCAAEPCAAEPRAASQAFGYGAPQSPTAEQVARYEASPGRASSQGSPRASSQGSPRHFSRGSLEARESASPPRWRARRGTARDGASEARREEDSRQLARPRNGARNGRSRRDDDGDWRSDPDSDVSGDGGRSNRRAHAVSRRGARRDAEDRIAPMLYDELDGAMDAIEAAERHIARATRIWRRCLHGSMPRLFECAARRCHLRRAMP
mmetsp:Transcript_9819/g.34610  ORF Transcript_9819/g.34610 Transcript_9819/m.34610 type:complete len:586 (+) Transcript_9819:94-1851(+)